MSVFIIKQYYNLCFIFKPAKAKKKVMSVSSDMSKNIRVGRSEKSFFIIIIIFF